ncbi:MAG: hypothetical protein EXS16_08535 [Gemmataceae bacterium]|nr:hypothetical protein [Gemmataceae bacterium]
MQFQFDIGSNVRPASPTQPPTGSDAVTQVLYQMLELQRDGFSQMLAVQREQLKFAQAKAADSVSRWRNILGRFDEEQPDFAANCKSAYPIIEKVYVRLLASMVDDLAQNGDDTLDSEFALQEFIDRYGMRVGQLSHLLGIIGPLSEAAHQNDQAAKLQEQQQPK